MDRDTDPPVPPPLMLAVMILLVSPNWRPQADGMLNDHCPVLSAVAVPEWAGDCKAMVTISPGVAEPVIVGVVVVTVELLVG